MKKTVITLVIFAFCFFNFIFNLGNQSLILAQEGGSGCSTNNDCPVNTCGGTTWCINPDNGHPGSSTGNGTCKATCGSGSSCTGSWSSWSACDGGCQYRNCSSPNILERRSCDGGSCDGGGGGGGDPDPDDSCSVTLTPVSSSIEPGEDVVFTASVMPSGGTVGWVGFTSNNTSAVTVTPATDTTSGYQTTATGVDDGAATITASVVMSGVVTCTDTALVTVTPPLAWWQVADSDVAANGNLESEVPTSLYFGLLGDGGWPGVPSYSGTTNLTSDNVSQTGWIANTPTIFSRVFDYQFFANQVPSDTVITNLSSNTVEGTVFESGGTESYGYFWYKFDGSSNGLDLTINSDMNLGSRKVILLVDSANVFLNGKINLTDGQGFFMLAAGINEDGAKGNISVTTNVGSSAGPELEGIYIADAAFFTGAATTQLEVRGSVVAYNGISLQRDLDLLNATFPAEYFEYAPDQILLFPSKLGFRKLNWKEVAP